MLRRAAPLLAGLALIAGCGGGDDGDGETGRPGSPAQGAEGDRLSREELIERADAVCRDANEREADLPQPTDLASAGDRAEQLIPIADELAERLRALRPPEELERPYGDYLDLIKEGRALLVRIRDSARADDLETVQSLLEEAEALNGRNDETAKVIGFKVCGVAG